MTPESIGFAHYLLAQIKCASVRSRLLTAEIDSVDAALRGDFVSADDALE